LTIKLLFFFILTPNLINFDSYIHAPFSVWSLVLLPTFVPIKNIINGYLFLTQKKEKRKFKKSRNKIEEESLEYCLTWW